MSYKAAVHRVPVSPLPARSSALAVMFDTEGTPVGTMAVVEAELVEDAQPIVGSVVIEAILSSFLTEDGRLVPARTATLALNTAADPATKRRIERAHQLDELRAAALADATLYGYGGHVKAWREWTKVEGIPALPLDPQAVANFLLDYALEWDFAADDYARDDDGHLIASVAMGTVGTRLQALNKLAEFVGLPRPGDNAGVKQVMAGMRRSFGTRTVGKAALDLALVNKLLIAADGLTYTAARDRAAHLLRARTDATTGQLARLTWANLDIEADEVVITYAKTSRFGAETTVTVPAHANPDLCLVRALRTLRTLAPKMREVLTKRTGQPLTRQAVHLIVGRDNWETLPGLDDRALARRLDDRAPVVPTSTARDRALVLMGFYTAMRRSNISMLNWADVTEQGTDGLSLLIRRSKTDQEGKGRVVWLPQADLDSGVECPATALRQWKAEVERSIGRPVKGTDPVLPSMTSAGETVKLTKTGRLTRLSGDAINATVQRLTVAAGLATGKKGERNPYGAHSLRAGFVTEALRDDKLNSFEVMEVTGHTSESMVARYRREANAAKSNGARKLLSALATS